MKHMYVPAYTFKAGSCKI